MSGCDLCAAAACRSLKLLRALRAKGAAWDRRVIVMAAAGDRVDVLEWALANGCPRPSAARVSRVAAALRRTGALEWIAANADKFGGL